MPIPGNLAATALENAGEAVAFGAGFALGRVLEPIGTGLAQEAWKQAPLRAPDAGTLAAGVAHGHVDPGAAAEWASEHGYSAAAFAALVASARVGPAIGYAYQAWRRGLLSDAEFDTALRRSGLEEQWSTAMRGLHDELLDPGAIATAIHRGIIAGQGLLLVEPPLGAGQIPHVRPSDIDGVQEAAGHGISPERLRVLIANTGLPLALGEMLRLLNMGKVAPDDVRRSVAQSNVRNEYMEAALELRRRLLTPNQYEEAALRGIITEAEADAGAALSGMEPADARLLFETLGRPVSVRAVTTGLARGGRLGGTYGDVPEPYRDAIRRSNVRPEYAGLAYANRYTLPGAFVLRSMVQAGELTAAEGETLLLESGWPPELAKKVAARWASGGHGAAKAETKAELEDEYAGGYMTEAELRAGLGLLGYAGHELDLIVHLNDARRVKRWREKVVDAIAAAYLVFKLDDATATAELADAGVTGQAATLLLGLWGMQRRDTIRALTVAEVKKAHKSGLLDTATALAELEHRDMQPADATIYLNS